MAGIELVTEGFKEGQVGSSAMPHKMNTRSCERVNGLAVVLRGQLSMVGELAGDQWNEGDVSCSVVRRVALPDAFFAADGLFQTFLTVLDEFGVFPAVMQRELDRYLPFLTTTKVLMAAVRNGVGREEAHEAIKEHAVAVALEMRQGARRERPVRAALGRPAARAGPGADRLPGGRSDRVHRCGARPGGLRRTPGEAALADRSRRRVVHARAPSSDPVPTLRLEGCDPGHIRLGSKALVSVPAGEIHRAGAISGETTCVCSRHARRTSAAIAVLCCRSPRHRQHRRRCRGQGQSVPHGAPSRPRRSSARPSPCAAIAQHLDALQAIADANDGTRASGTPGYTAHAQLRRAASSARPATSPTVQSFDFPYFSEDADAVARADQPVAEDLRGPADFATMTFSGSGDTTAPVVAVDTDLVPSSASSAGARPRTSPACRTARSR